jgi:hypothetical protein
MLAKPDGFSRFRCLVFDKLAMNDPETALAAVPDALDALIKDGALRRYKKHAMIISEGDAGERGRGNALINGLFPGPRNP